MWNMAKGEVSFVVWLHAIAVVKNAMKGDFNTAEAQYWYTEGLRKIRQEIAGQVQHGKFSDHLFTAMACIQATAVSVRPSLSNSCNREHDFKTTDSIVLADLT